MLLFPGNFLIYCSALKPFKKSLSRLLNRWRSRDDVRPSESGIGAAAAGTAIGASPRHNNASAAAAEFSDKGRVAIMALTVSERKKRLIACPKERTRAVIMTQKDMGKGEEGEAMVTMGSTPGTSEPLETVVVFQDSGTTVSALDDKDDSPTPPDQQQQQQQQQQHMSG